VTDNSTFGGKVAMGDAGISPSWEFPVNIDINSSTTQLCGLEIQQRTNNAGGGTEALMRFKNADGNYGQFGMTYDGTMFLANYNGGYNKNFQLDVNGNATFAGDAYVGGSGNTGEFGVGTTSLDQGSQGGRTFTLLRRGGTPDWSSHLELTCDTQGSGKSMISAYDLQLVKLILAMLDMLQVTKVVAR
jgi:hypothetical protein